MYLEHFGLRDLPFSLTPDTHYFFDCPSHREALAVLLVALRSGEGFTKLVGEVGTGKTLVCRKLLRVLGSGFVTAYVPNPFLSPKGLLCAVTEELGVAAPRGADARQIFNRLTDFLVSCDREQRRVVLLLDEAQALPERSLEMVRLLTNLETETRKLLQVTLFGQPELDERLAAPSLRQLAQRISFSCRLRPLRPAEVATYVRHRLRVAGHWGPELFSAAALKQLARASDGVPRLVNVLGHKALLAAYGRGDAGVGREHVRRAVADTESVSARAGRRTRWSLRLGPIRVEPGARTP